MFDYFCLMTVSWMVCLFWIVLLYRLYEVQRTSLRRVCELRQLSKSQVALWSWVLPIVLLLCIRVLLLYAWVGCCFYALLWNPISIAILYTPDIFQPLNLVDTLRTAMIKMFWVDDMEKQLSSMNYLGVGGVLERVVHSEAHCGGKPLGVLDSHLRKATQD